MICVSVAQTVPWGGTAVQHRRILIPLALAGSFGIALAPTFASASATSHSALSSAASSAVAKAAGFKVYSSPAGKSVYRRSAVSNTSTPNPKLAVAITVIDTSAYGVEVTAKVTGLTTGTATVKVNWGDNESDPATVTASSLTVKLPHEYGQVGNYNIYTTVADGSGDTAINSIDVPTAGSAYNSYGPLRILDTRSGLGTAAAPVAAHGTLKFKVTGKGVSGDTIPSGITAIALNVTVTQPKANGVLAAYNDEDAYGDAMSDPGTSNLNFSKGQSVANLVIVPVGANGEVDFHNESTGSTQVIADVEGYFSTGSVNTYHPTTPTRILDTRKGIGTEKVARVAPGGNVTLKVWGEGVVSDTADSVQLNITATGGSRGGFITAYDGAGTYTAASTLNYAAGQTVANNAIVEIGHTSSGLGEITLHNSGSGTVDLIADVSGYFDGGSATRGAAFVPLPEPTRLLDTRQLDGALTLDAGKPLALPLSQDSALTAWVFNTTVTDTTGSGFLSVYPYNPDQPSAVPTTSTLNYTKGETVPNLTIAAPGTVADSNYSGSFDNGYYVGGTGTAQFVLDAFGFFYNK